VQWCACSAQEERRELRDEELPAKGAPGRVRADMADKPLTHSSIVDARVFRGAARPAQQQTGQYSWVGLISGL
jgi:hypothetical protein